MYHEKKNAVFSQKESTRYGCVGGCAQLPALPPTHPLLDRGMVLEAPACCRIFGFVFRKQIAEPRISLARGCGSSRQRGRKFGQGGWELGGRGCGPHLSVPAAGADSKHLRPWTWREGTSRIGGHRSSVLLESL